MGINKNKRSKYFLAFNAWLSFNKNIIIYFASLECYYCTYIFSKWYKTKLWNLTKLRLQVIITTFPMFPINRGHES